MPSWNKGETKYTNESVMKISKTLSLKPKSNFWRWQQLHKVNYTTPKPSSILAELYGTILGDGCIEKLPRTEKLTISFNRKEQGHIAHVERIITKIFHKAPSRRIRTSSQCDDLYLYQNFLSKRLNFPIGTKLEYKLQIPEWIKSKKEYLRECLKGLFETDGDWVVDKKYKTNVIKFTNHCQTLLDDIYNCLCKLGYRPQRRTRDIRLAKNAEVARFVHWIQFRQYE